MDRLVAGMKRKVLIPPRDLFGNLYEIFEPASIPATEIHDLDKLVRDPRVTATICGVTKPERVQQTLDWANFPVPETCWRELMELPFETNDPEATRVYKLG